MPALWQSSQRPMYVKTVWIDGFRHAILTKDDPYLARASRRRPHSSASCGSKVKTRHDRLSQPADELQNCLKKYNLVIKSDKSNFAFRRPRSSQEPRVEKLNLSDIDQDSEDELVLRANPQPLCEFDSCRSKFNNLTFNMRTVRSNRTARSDVKEDTELSDRVLQWLDLAGKVDLLAPENVERMNQPRHSWPEIQKRNQCLTKSKTTLDLRARDTKNCTSKESGRVQQSIDRENAYIPTSANTIENYARQSRNAKCTPRNEASHKTKDNKTKTKDTRQNVVETRQKVAMELNAVERQYAELVNKKLIPDVNKSAKKQVHIFMPEAVTKKFGSTTTSRTESLLSQKY